MASSPAPSEIPDYQSVPLQRSQRTARYPIQGAYVDMTTVPDNEMIQRFADKFLTAQERRHIATLLNKAENALTFTPDEMQLLSSGSATFVESNTGVDGIGVPITQFYDYCMTLRELLGMLHARQTQIGNLDQISDSIAAIKKDIFHPTYVPWSIIDSLPDKRRIEVDGRRLGEDVKRVRDQEGVERIAPKTRYDKCFDEAKLLSSNIVNYIVALSQGLFKNYNTLATDIDGNILSAKMWINASFIPRELVSQVTPLLPQIQAAEYFSNNWVAQYLVDNGFPDLANLESDTKWPNEKRLSYNAAVPLGGGAIGLYQWFKYRTTPDGMEFDYTPAGSNNPNLNSIQNLNINVDLDVQQANQTLTNAQTLYLDTIPEEALYLNWASMRQYMAARRDHPIFVAPRLADAYNYSGLGDYLMEMYMGLQREFAAKLLTTRVGRSLVDVRTMWRDYANGLGATHVNSCGGNTMTVYRDYNGNMVSGRNATFVQGDKEYLLPNVNPTSATCVPLIPVQDETVPLWIQNTTVNLGLAMLV